MSNEIARVGDLAAGTCTAHAHPRSWTGAILTGSSILTVEGPAAARVGDTGNTDCGHHFQIIAGSSILTVAGIQVARKGDPVIVIEGGSGTIIGGAATTTAA